MFPLYLVKHNALFCTNYTAYRKKYVFSSGGSEKNRSITGADVRTGDHLPSRMRVAVLSTGQQLCRRRTAGCWSMLEHSDSGKNNSIRFDSIHADESIFRFDSIRFDSQFDKTDACTLIVTHRLIISYDCFLIVCIIDYFVKF